MRTKIVMTFKPKLVWYMMSYSQEQSQTSDKTKPENETNFWSEFTEKKDAIFSQLKNKFSNQERRGQKVEPSQPDIYCILHIFNMTFLGFYSGSACLFTGNKATKQSETKSFAKCILEEIFLSWNPCWSSSQQRWNVSQFFTSKLFFIFKRKSAPKQLCRNK